MTNQIDKLMQEILKSINYMIEKKIKNTTKIYSGIIISSNNDGKWNVKYNGEIHSITPHRLANPEVGQVVSVFIPQGNQAISFFL